MSAGFLFPFLENIRVFLMMAKPINTQGATDPRPENADFISPLRSVEVINGNCLGISGASGNSAVS